MAPEPIDAELIPPPSANPAGASPAEVVSSAEGAVLDLSQVEKDSKNGRRLIPSEVRVLLDLHAKGLSQREIATRVNCHQSTVQRWLAAFDDTRTLAKARLRGGALDLADRILEHAKPEEAIKVLQGLDVLETKKGADAGVRVIVGVALKTGG